MQFDPSLPWRDIRGTGFSSHIGPIRFARAADDRFHAALELRDIHINVGGVCHGGVLLSLADVAMGAGSFAAGNDHPCATIQIDGHFLAAAKQGQTLLAEARQNRRVRALSFMECDIWAGERRVMRASGIWKYLESRTPGAAPEPLTAG